MNTTSPVITVTDDLIEQLEALTCIDEGGAVLIHTDQVRGLLTELRRLRAENAELTKDAERYRFLRDLPEGSEYEEIGNYPGCWWDDSIDAAMRATQ